LTTIVVEPHCDDAFLGCYSFLKLGMIDGIITIADCGEKRNQENETMADYFNIDSRRILDYPYPILDGELVNHCGEIQSRLDYVDELGYADIVFVPSPKEKHIDHKIVSGLKFRCSKIIEYSVNAVPDNLYTDKYIFTQVDLEEKMDLFKKLYPSQYISLKSTNFEFLENEYFKVRK